LFGGMSDKADIVSGKFFSVFYVSVAWELKYCKNNYSKEDS